MKFTAPAQGRVKIHRPSNLHVLAPGTQVTVDADCLESPTLTVLSSDIVAVLAEYAGEIHTIEGGEVCATLIRDGQRYTANLPLASFEPGGPLVPGQTFLGRWVLRQNGHESWSNLPDPPQAPTVEELEQWDAEFARFRDSGL